MLLAFSKTEDRLHLHLKSSSLPTAILGSLCFLCLPDNFMQSTCVDYTRLNILRGLDYTRLSILLRVDYTRLSIPLGLDYITLNILLGLDYMGLSNLWSK